LCAKLLRKHFIGQSGEPLEIIWAVTKSNHGIADAGIYPGQASRVFMNVALRTCGGPPR